MYPIIFSIGQLNIYSHGVLTVLGAVLGAWFLYYLARKEKILNFIFLEFILAITIGGLIGARVIYVLIYPDQFANIWETFYFWNGGMVSFGGFLGGIVTGAYYLKYKKQNIWQWFDVSIFGLMIGQAVGRIGCFLAGDVIGRFSLSKFTVQAQFPVALFESLWIIIFLPLLYLLYLKKKNWSKGIIFCLGLIFYGAGRFFIDYLRADSYSFGGISYSQAGSLLTILVAIVLIFGILKLKEEDPR